MRIALKLFALCCIFSLTIAVYAQNTPSCGIVDAIDFPITDITEMARGSDDFGLFRERFSGLHTGIDIGFDRWGDPIHAAARGRVTYADPEGWDTEKGVVIVEHTFPDGSVYYSLYGHVEQTDTISFPSVNDCVELGDVIAAIGWPSLGRPHLHYEIRSFLPDDGGPGYVDENPLLRGWMHPVDFTRLWQTRLLPGYLSSVSFEFAPSQPPVLVDSGIYVIASADFVIGVQPTGTTLWRVQGDSVIIGLRALPGNRVVAYTSSGQVMVLQGGRYAALWRIDGPEETFVMVGTEILVFATDDGIAAYDTLGNELWTAPSPISGNVTYFAANDSQVMLARRGEEGEAWSIYNAQHGTVTITERVSRSLVAAPGPAASWFILDGTALSRFADGMLTSVATISPVPGRTARMVIDSTGGSYIHLADAENTMLAFDADGVPRWRTIYPYIPAIALPPIMATDTGCLLYTLDADGMLNAFSAADGMLLRQVRLYSGGERTGSPGARILSVSATGQLQVGAGFLSLVNLDGRTLFGGNPCLAG